MCACEIESELEKNWREKVGSLERISRRLMIVFAPCRRKSVPASASAFASVSVSVSVSVPVSVSVSVMMKACFEIDVF